MQPHAAQPPAWQGQYLWPILVLFLALHMLYNWAIPLGEGPDEPGHLAYTLFLLQEARLPVQRPAPAASDVPGEGHQPPLAYALALPAVAWLPADQRTILLTTNPHFLWAGGDDPAAFMRASHERWPWQGLSAAWHMVRAVSGLWGAVVIGCTYLAARQLAPNTTWLAPLAALLVTCNPQFLFITALAGNDALLAALAASLLWWSLRPSPMPYRWAVTAGLLFGLALVTKQSALLLGPLLLWGGWRAGNAVWPRFAAITLLWMGVALLSASWWYLRNQALYGDIFGLAAFSTEFGGQPFNWGDPGAWVAALGQLFGSFWARFGWMSLPAPGWVLNLYGLLCALALGGGLLALVRRIPQRGQPGLHSASLWLAPLLAILMALAWTLAFVATAGLVGWQGRMLFPALAAFALSLAAGLAHLKGQHPRPSLSPTGAVLALGLGLVALAAWLPFGVIRPAYQWVALAPATALAQLGTPTYARYAADWEQGVVLRGWHLDGPPRPGTTITLQFTWNSLEPIPRPWTVFVHLVAADERIVAESNSQPRAGSLPFPRWTPGDWMQDQHQLHLPANLPPGTYHLRVGLYRPDKDGRRQPVWAADGSTLGDLAELGTLVVTP